MSWDEEGKSGSEEMGRETRAWTAVSRATEPECRERPVWCEAIAAAAMSDEVAFMMRLIRSLYRRGVKVR